MLGNCRLVYFCLIATLSSSAEPVKMAQLLSMDYQQQWLEETRYKDEEQRRKAKVRSLRTIIIAGLCLPEHNLILLVYVYQSTTSYCWCMFTRAQPHIAGVCLLEHNLILLVYVY